MSSGADLVGVGRRYVVGRCFAYWQDGTRANGTFIWGRPEEDDLAQLEPLWALAHGPRFDGRAVFIDARDVASVDALALKRLLSYLVSRDRRMDEGVRSMTMIHGGGIVGVVTAGLLNVVRPTYAFRAVAASDVANAFEASDVGELFAPVEALRRQLCHTPDVVRSVQSQLQHDLSASAADIAARLGLSSRTLQRRLDDAGTSLRVERQKLVLRHAEALLAETRLDLDAIAARLGLASASHLVATFRRTHGVTPGAWRSQQRP